MLANPQCIIFDNYSSDVEDTYSDCDVTSHVDLKKWCVILLLFYN